MYTLPEVLALFCYTQQWQDEEEARRLEQTRILALGVALAFQGGAGFNDLLKDLDKRIDLLRHVSDRRDVEIPAAHLPFFRPQEQSGG